MWQYCMIKNIDDIWSESLRECSKNQGLTKEFILTEGITHEEYFGRNFSELKGVVL